MDIEILEQKAMSDVNGKPEVAHTKAFYLCVESTSFTIYCYMYLTDRDSILDTCPCN